VLPIDREPEQQCRNANRRGERDRDASSERIEQERRNCFEALKGNRQTNDEARTAAIGASVTTTVAEIRPTPSAIKATTMLSATRSGALSYCPIAEGHLGDQRPFRNINSLRAVTTRGEPPGLMTLKLARLALSAGIVTLALADWSGRHSWRAVSGFETEPALIVPRAAQRPAAAARGGALHYFADPASDELYVVSGKFSGR
jgi:hypothetical protein